MKTIKKEVNMPELSKEFEEGFKRYVFKF